MFARTLQALRFRLRGTLWGRILRRTGITALGRAAYECWLIRQGLHQANLMGCPLRFVVVSSQEIRHIDSFVNEEPFVGRILEVMEPGDVFYDVGANIGMVSLVVASKHRRAGVTVYAFEPEPANVDHLRRNIELNNASNVVVYALALGAEDETAQLFVEGETGSGRHSLVSGRESAVPSIEIHVVSGTRFAENSGSPPDLVKIDVEGAEMLVLRGMTGLFDERRIRDVFIEVHPTRLGQAGSSAGDIQHWLEERGYGLVWSRDRKTEIHQHYHRAMNRGHH